jgi:hypothetical protein
LLWVFIGKSFAEGRLTINKNFAITGSIFFGLLLFLEYYIAITCLGVNNAVSCYLSLVPFTIFLFALMLKAERIHIKNSKTLRNMSTLIYVSHCAVLKCVSIVLERLLNRNDKLFVFVVSCVVLIIATRFLLYLYEKKKWNILEILW